MSNVSIQLTPALRDYLLAVSLREPRVLRELRAETAKLADANMQIAPEQGQFMRLLITLINGRRGIEIGTFTGYSAICMTLALPADGELIACDISAEWTNIARRYFVQAGVAEKIDLRLAPALHTLDALIAAGRAGQFDFAFLDADKESYLDYYERVLTLLRPNGLLLVDNVLWDGKVIQNSEQDSSTRAIRAFNAHLHGDDRVEISILPVADGLTLVRKY